MSVTIDTLTKKIRAFRSQEQQFLTAAHEAAGAAKAMEVMLSELVQAERKAKAEAAAATPLVPAEFPPVPGTPESVDAGYENQPEAA